MSAARHVGASTHSRSPGWPLGGRRGAQTRKSASPALLACTVRGLGRKPSVIQHQERHQDGASARRAPRQAPPATRCPWAEPYPADGSTCVAAACGNVVTGPEASGSKGNMMMQDTGVGHLLATQSPRMRRPASSVCPEICSQGRHNSFSSSCPLPINRQLPLTSPCRAASSQPPELPHWQQARFQCRPLPQPAAAAASPPPAPASAVRAACRTRCKGRVCSSLQQCSLRSGEGRVGCKLERLPPCPLALPLPFPAPALVSVRGTGGTPSTHSTPSA